MVLEMYPPLNAIHGYASPQLQATLERSAHLAEKLSRPRDLMSCLVGLCAVRFVQGHVTDAYEFATRALDLAEAEPKTAGQAERVVAGSLTSLGRLEEALDHFERCRELSRDSVSLSWAPCPRCTAGHGVRTHSGCSETPEQAIARSRRPSNREVSRPPVQPCSCPGLLSTRRTSWFNNRASASEAANELISLCERYSFSFYGQWGVVVDGWVRGGEAGIVRIQQGIDKFRSAGQNARMPYWLNLLAEVHGPDGARRSRSRHHRRGPRRSRTAGRAVVDARGAACAGSTFEPRCGGPHTPSGRDPCEEPAQPGAAGTLRAGPGGPRRRCRGWRSCPWAMNRTLRERCCP